MYMLNVIAERTEAPAVFEKATEVWSFLFLLACDIPSSYILVLTSSSFVLAFLIWDVCRFLFIDWMSRISCTTL